MEIDGEEAANRRLLHYNDIDFTNLTNVPTPEAGDSTCIYVGDNKTLIQPSDTLHVQLNNSYFICRVLEIKPVGLVDRESLRLSRLANPLPGRQGTYDNLVCIQLYRYCNNENINSNTDLNYVAPNEELSNASIGIQEVAATNATIWVTPSQLHDVAYIIHEEDAINHIYGPIAKRRNFYMLRYKAHYTADATHCNFSKYSYASYRLLLKKGSTTALSLDSLATVSVACNKMLAKSTQLPSILTHHLSMDQSAFDHFKQAIPTNDDNITIKTTNNYNSQYIQHADLSLETKTIKHPKTTIKIKGHSGIATIRSVLGVNIGVSLSKKFPKAPSRYYNNQNVKRSAIIPMDKTDTIKMLDLSEQNYIQFVYDELERCLTIKMKCTPKVVNEATNNLILTEYLNSNVRHLDHEVREGIVLKINEEYWQVISVSGWNCTIKKMVHGQNVEEIRKRDDCIPFCITNLN